MAFDLPRKSKEFADDLGELLNATVCHGPKLKTLVFPTFTLVGYNVSRDNVRGEGLPIRIRKAPKFYLGLSIRLQERDGYLTVMSSAMVLATEATITNQNMLLHYDYEREKQDGYPEAHLQICATSEAWEEAGRRHDGDIRLLNKLHLPVGGRRFRPTLEDIIEFLIVEELVEARPKWKATLEASRDAFREKQLRAAVRQFPEVALDQLQKDNLLP
jgi:hypothetical protein